MARKANSNETSLGSDKIMTDAQAKKMLAEANRNLRAENKRLREGLEKIKACVGSSTESHMIARNALNVL